MVLKSAQDRNALLEKRIQTIIVEANAEITLLQQKSANLESGALWFHSQAFRIRSLTDRVPQNWRMTNDATVTSRRRFEL